MKKYIKKERTTKNMGFIQKLFEDSRPEKNRLLLALQNNPDEHKAIENSKQIRTL